ncbi:MAG: branched-chain amino acid aminotransferase [Acidimicrobiales bacterium]|jgi:branched-chain amino acid aminotransferase
MSGLNDAVMWVDGSLIPAADATVHVLSHAVQRGSTVFDVLRIVELDEGPAAFGLREHVARFDRSMHLMGMEPAFEIGQIERAVAHTVLANPGATVVKLVAAWVSTPTGTLPDSLVPQLSIAALETQLTMPGTVRPVRAASVDAPKMPADVLPPSLKVAAAYTYGIRQKMLAMKRHGVDEIILRTPDGDLAESVSQSVFAVVNSQLLLPPLNTVLDGITRRMVIDVAHHLGVSAQIRSVGWDEITAADEIFLCSTTNPVLPVSELDGRRLDPGPITRQLGVGATAVLDGQHELSTRWLTPLAN